MIKKILIGLAVVLAGLFTYAGFQPAEMKVSREMLISASPEKIFPYINHSKKSYEWMPWASGDPTLQIEFTGPEEGVGASSQWKGKEMGVGRSQVIESVPLQRVRTELEYTQPFTMKQIAEISLTPNPEGTLVKWSVEGSQGIFFRLVGIFVNCDRMIGDEFNKGLSQLKALTEAGVK